MSPASLADKRVLHELEGLEVNCIPQVIIYIHSEICFEKEQKKKKKKKKK